MNTLDPWPEWIDAHRDALTKHSYGHELKFVESVLRWIAEIDPNWITHEFPFQDSRGGNRRVDFVLQHRSMQRPIAIEIDGRVKREGPSTRKEHDDFFLRQNALTALDFRLLRFTNAQVASNPVAIRGEISHAIGTEQIAAQRARANQYPEAAAASSTVGESGHPYALAQSPPDQLGTSDYLDQSTPSEHSTSPDARLRQNRAWIVAASAAAMIGLVALGVWALGDGTTQAASRGVPPASTNTCPETHPIKGNESLREEGVVRIFHVPDGRFYERTNPVECFANEADADSAGYRASQGG